MPEDEPRESLYFCDDEARPVSISAPYTDPTLSGFLYKRGRRTGLWNRGYYAIANSSFCELAEPPATAKTAAVGAVSIIPVSVDTSDRASVRRALPLSDVLSCEPLADEGGIASLATLMRGASPPAAVATGEALAASRVFRLTTATRVYTFRSEQAHQAAAWVVGLQLVAGRNTGRADEAANMVHVIVTDHDPKEPPLSIYIRGVGSSVSPSTDAPRRLL
jgi:hypothetical protein